MDRLDAMTAFVAVADLHGFAPAARRLKVSPSAVTRLVAALEERLGIRLLQRTTRSVALTDAGARYLDRARRILADVDDAESTAQAERTEPTGRFVVSAPLVFGRLHVAPLMCKFLLRHLSVNGKLLLTDRLAHLVDDGIDLAVRIGDLADSSLVARRVGATRRVVVGSPQYLTARGRPRGPRDLEAHDLIHFTALESSPEWRFACGGAEERVPFTSRYVTNSADAAIGHAMLGGGIAMVLAYQVADAVREGHLEILLPGFEPAPLPISLVHLATRLPSAKLRAFLDLTATECDWRFVDL